jgi:hypothetical protein
MGNEKKNRIFICVMLRLSNMQTICKNIIIQAAVVNRYPFSLLTHSGSFSFDAVFNFGLGT